jgi:hypothetical protein
VLCAIAYGFAFGEDWGESQSLDKTMDYMDALKSCAEISRELKEEKEDGR